MPPGTHARGSPVDEGAGRPPRDADLPSHHPSNAPSSTTNVSASRTCTWRGVMHPNRARSSMIEKLPPVLSPGSTTRHRKSRWLSTGAPAGSTWVASPAVKFVIRQGSSTNSSQTIPGDVPAGGCSPVGTASPACNCSSVLGSTHPPCLAHERGAGMSRRLARRARASQKVGSAPNAEKPWRCWHRDDMSLTSCRPARSNGCAKRSTCSLTTTSSAICTPRWRTYVQGAPLLLTS